LSSSNGVRVTLDAVAASANRLRAVENEVDTGLKDFPGAILDLTDTWTGSIGASFRALADSWTADAGLWTADLSRISYAMVRAATGIEQATQDSARIIAVADGAGLDEGNDQVSPATNSSAQSSVAYHAARLGAVN
jgi:uncharacterized protein YukE